MDVGCVYMDLPYGYKGWKNRVSVLCAGVRRAGRAGWGRAQAAAHLPAPQGPLGEWSPEWAGHSPPHSGMETRRLLSGDAQELELFALIESHA